ncbi:recombinase family protein [Roseobacter sp. HKCCD9010]|uniref:recombinase family protein n=1 Tax=unclassified Roseobacter TaxID=196798 RepID=UPI001491F431|nr:MULTISPECIES: recombinase family protein [unclassified Roseobacter]MBF9052046.1 recombinase family protein [Rhodobacterales bacterium HKCCD4356]NNV13970.1 recombinase family protein [Roseobacter sp. HKCCD7357]NNV18211.1 recombinase family protein [Roseobacter sp. HKCCD8768]NNV27671.1 recombinase family protein [Roseobacter sp. HKCCD8192]NNV31983.1 recombinase family protein [Roseobacter sp. HKCCD9061]
MEVGYARVSTADQSVEGQTAALKAAGCERVFTEVASGANKTRPVLAEALEFLRPGDKLVVFKLDRVARSLPHLIELMDRLKVKDIAFKSLTEEINTTTPGGKLLFHLMAAIAEFERDLIRERTMVGLKAAKAKGRTGGRPRQMTEEKIKAVRTLLANGTAVKDAAQAVGVSVPTLYRHLPGSAR